jgi:DNA-binding HxlR family transcriptional regulator
VRWTELEGEKCPVARAMSVIGDRWTVLILRDCLRGVSRFDEFQRRLGCSRAIVADRLALLVERGVLAREAYEIHPPRHDYRLTEMGRSLGPVLMTMSNWAETWMPIKGGHRVVRRHKTCGHAFQPALHCSECGEPIGAGEVEYVDPVKTPALARR